MFTVRVYYVALPSLHLKRVNLDILAHASVDNSAMPEGLEVVIKYKNQKYIQLSSPNLSHSQEIAILKKDLAHLRVHSPAQKNVTRDGGSFILHWPSATTSPKGLADSLHRRWFSLCSDDPETLKLREFLSIESIMVTQDGVFLRSTDDQESNEGAHETERRPQSALVPAPAPTYTSHAPSPSKAPPTAPRSDRLHYLKRKLSNTDGPPPTRPKLDTRDTLPHLSSTSPRGDQQQIPYPFEGRPSMPTTTLALTQSPAQSLVVQAQTQPHTPMIIQRPPTPVPESGEVTPLPGTPTYVSTPTLPQVPFTYFSSPVSIPPATFTPFSAPSPDTSASFYATLPVPSTRLSGPSPGPSFNSALALSPAPALAAVPPTGPLISPAPVPTPAPVAVAVAVPAPALPTGPRHSPTLAPPTGPRLSPPTQPHLSPRPHPPSRSHSHSHSHSHPTSPHPHPKTKAASPNDHGNGDPSRRRDVQRLTRELWDTRRQLTAVQAREQVILDDLERLGARPEVGVGVGVGSDRSNSRDEFQRLETELHVERTRRTRAERLLTDVERECRAPFVVPALFQAFVTMSELAS